MSFLYHIFFQVLYDLCFTRPRYQGERLQDHWSSGLFLQVMRTIIRAWTSLNFGGIPLLTSELAALERLKKPNFKLVS